MNMLQDNADTFQSTKPAMPQLGYTINDWVILLQKIIASVRNGQIDDARRLIDIPPLLTQLYNMVDPLFLQPMNIQQINDSWNQFLRELGSMASKFLKDGLFDDVQKINHKLEFTGVNKVQQDILDELKSLKRV